MSLMYFHGYAKQCEYENTEWESTSYKTVLLFSSPLISNGQIPYFVFTFRERKIWLPWCQLQPKTLESNFPLTFRNPVFGILSLIESLVADRKWRIAL